MIGMNATKHSAAILGVGTARPPLALSQDDAAEAAAGCCAPSERRKKLLEELYRQTRVATRRSVLLKPGRGDAMDAESIRWFYPSADQGAQGPTTSDRMAHYRAAAPALAAEACRAALDAAGVASARVTHLVTITCTGFASPGVEVELIKRLGLPATVGRTHIGFMGCHAALNGLRVARAFASSDPEARVLMCCVELCSLHFQYGWDSRRVLTNALFADGAGAVVVGARAGAGDRAWRIVDTESEWIPDTEDEMSWHVGDHGFMMSLSSRVPQLVGEHAARRIAPWLARHGLTVNGVGSWAVHPGGPRIVSEVQSALGLRDAAVAVSHEMLRTCGNMSSATILFILEALIRADAPRPCVAMSFGPGLISEMALLA